MNKLAINGGKKVRNTLFPAYQIIGKEEEDAVVEVLRSGVLSKFLGTWGNDFYGGPQVRALEEEWAAYYGVKHAIALNSATSGLYCAAGAIGLNPGDEVIVSPYTMCASATAPLIYQAIPVFADIEPEYFCLDPKSIEEKITEKTKAIIIVDLFGQPYDADAINQIARKHNLMVIEDNAQAPGATYKGKMAGTLGDIGVFSLNYHKHIHCGEGGIVVTNNNELAERVRLIRNHAEAVVDAKGTVNLNNMVGFNFRMTELEAAIAREQLKKLDMLLDLRRKNVEYLEKGLQQIKCIKNPLVREKCEHSYYVHALTYNKEKIGVSREKFVEAVKAELMPIKLRETEGICIGNGYVRPLYLLPMYQKKQAFGDTNVPFEAHEVSYNKGICPVCENLYEETLITHELMRPFMTENDLDDVIDAFKKVFENCAEL